MKRPPFYWNIAKRKLCKKDPVLRKIIKKYNKGFLTTRNNPFFSLCRTITGQQISTKAADSIWKKFEKKCKNKINPKQILNTKNLRSAGLSRQKVKYIKNLAKCFINKSFDPIKIKRMSDLEAINYISKLNGLGVWSAEMFLMFNLNRPNIFPVKDIGLLKAISKNYKTSYPPSKKFLDKISNKHMGFRSVFTWYMWRSIDPVDVDY
tara:strand:+ start:84 stop:704 length:621 start_codon:yes stop_codon:yes gene_type:complete